MTRILKNYISRKGVLYFAGIAVLILLSFLAGKGCRETSASKGSEHTEDVKESDETQIWTCSMHPRIRREEPGKCPICFMDLIPVSDAEGTSGDESPILTISENAKIMADIRTTEVKRQPAEVRITMNGKVAFDETSVGRITSRVSGRIDRLYVDYTGIPVKQGDHLERIYSPELISLQKEIQEAKKSGKEDTERNSLVTRSRERSLKAAKEKLRLLGFKKWKIDNIVSREKSSEYMTIRAHQKGVVIKKMIEEGSYVKTGDPLFHIADLSRVWIKLEAYEADLTWLRLGQKVVFSVSAFPGEEFTGTVSFIDPVVDPSTRTVKVRVIADNKDMRLKPEMFVKAVVKPEVSKTGKVINKEMKGKWISPMHPQVVKDGPGTCDICGMPLVKAEELGYVTSGFEEIEPILIPATAPLITGKRAVVYVELQNTGNPTYEGREIKLGPRVGNYYIVRSGLSAGEEVVVNGAFKIDGELQIRAKPSMMNTQEPDSEKNLLPQGLDPEDHAEEEFKPADPEVLPEGFKKELNRLYSSYFKTAEGLKQDNLENTVSGLEAVHSSLVKIREGSKDTHSDWETIEQGLQRELIDIDKIASLSDARTLFYSISKVLIAAEKRYNKVLSSKHFLAFCPMAFNNQGAYWLQEDREIKNPYFGESMLGCGEIKEEYKNTGNFTD